ncbi:DUF7117 family protein [Halorientalis marina]|uniref:DUF7117 family protein n=1 Tax=Halorientalis marina TaxID=2931976 RepID=UPI001FF64FF2|nr:TFIIB-type zinc ribbon-containing protein [Halorientalis marina]
MKIRGDRECKACGTRWSYYDTGSVACPECGSLQSIGVDDRKEHTTAPIELDLTCIRSRVGDEPLWELADEAATVAGEYVRRQGFIDAGDLQPLDETYLAATELRHAARLFDQSLRADSDEEYYLLSLLRGADQGDRPSVEEVPESVRTARGLAYARAVDDYCRDLRTAFEGDPDPAVADLLSMLGEHRKRIQALDGDVPVSDAEALVKTARALGRGVIDDDENALAEARAMLDGLGP